MKSRKHLRARSILSLTVFEFEYSSSQLGKLRTLVRGLKWRKNGSNDTSALMLNSLPQFASLHVWFAECIEQVRRHLGLPFERIVITQSWANRSMEGQWHARHCHPNSYLSGVFYLDASSQSGFTEFIRSDPWFDFFLLEGEGDRGHELRHQVAPRPGVLLLFPSSMDHLVGCYTDSQPRFSIAFNAFPEGRISPTRRNLRFLEILVKPYSNHKLHSRPNTRMK